MNLIASEAHEIADNIVKSEYNEILIKIHHNARIGKYELITHISHEQNSTMLLCAGYKVKLDGGLNTYKIQW